LLSAPGALGRTRAMRGVPSDGEESNHV
jgi:hypothetical protein